MEGKQISLRYAGVCAICGKALAVHSRAFWHQDSHTVQCLACAATPASTTSEAGRSAKRKSERLRTNALHRDDASRWEKGAEGEEFVGARLDDLRDDGFIVRHDLRVPGSRAANIDHLVVARSGVHVIDTKHWKGRIETRRSPSGLELYVGSRRRTSAVDKLATQILAVDRATRDLNLPTPITSALCFVHGDWPFLTRGYDIRGVRILWPRKLMQLIRRPGPLTDDQIAHAGQRIFERLPLG